MGNGYALQTTTKDEARQRAEQFLHAPSAELLLAVDYDEPGLLEAMQQIDHIFTDADGTIMDDGAEQLQPDKIALFQQIARLGIGITIVTGKPLAEVVPLRQTMPTDIPISFICEKGAYDVHFDESGAWREYILSNAEHEQSVAALREEFEGFSHQLVKQHGSKNLGFGWGGSGEHKSALSVDIFSGPPPSNYLTLRGAERDALKLKDAALLAQVEHEIAEWVDKQRPGWRVVHVGNANTEITPGGIGKSEAIVESAEFGAARKVLLLGDSLNDKSMLQIGKKFSGKAVSGLVLHRSASLPLVEYADIISFGMAHSNPILHALIQSHR